MTIPPDTLGQYIGTAIKRDGRTLDQLAAAADIAASYLSRIRTDKLVPGPDVLERLAQVLSLDLAQVRQLAEAAQAQRRVAKRQIRVRRDQDYLRRHAPQTLEETSRPPYAEPLSRLLATAYQGWQDEEPRATVAAAGRATPTPVLVLDLPRGTARGIPMQIVGPKLVPDGSVTFRVQSAHAATLPDEFSLEVIFLGAVPYPECLYTLRLGAAARQQMGARFGLEVTVPLPGLGQDRAFPERDARSLALRGAFAFRIVC